MKTERNFDDYMCFTTSEFRSLLAKMTDEESDAIDAHANHCEACRVARDEVLDRFSEEPLIPSDQTPETDRAIAAEVSTAGDMSAFANRSPLPIIDGLQVQHKLGRGGMGLVYLATEPALERNVAVKVVGPGMDGSEGMKRFQEEKKLHASNSHPNIVNFYRESKTDDGRPCFIMEYLDGGPITQYCVDEKLPLRQRLEMFVSVCEAVQHLHTLQIVHRDLAPQNILVGTKPSPVAKIIDFGIAKNTKRQPETTDPAYASSLLGHVSYMSPEQTGGRYKEINDSRTDVYSLGVLLYELLTGSPPLTSDYARSLSDENIVKEICESVPSKVSDVLSTLESAKAHATTMQISSDELSREVEHELDWIVSKALQKAPKDRYGTAAEMAADLHVYLSGGVLEATSPTRLRRSRKWCSGNRYAAAFLGVLAVGVPLLLTAMAFGLIQQRNAIAYQQDTLKLAKENERIVTEKLATETAAKLREKQLRVEAEQLREKETQDRIKIERQASDMRTLNSVLQTVFEGFNPNLETAGDGELRTAFVGRMKNVANEIVEKQLGDNDDGVAMKEHLAETLNVFGEVGVSIELWKSIIEDQEKRKGRIHEGTLKGLLNLGRTQLRAEPADALATMIDVKEIANELYSDGSTVHDEVDHILAQAYSSAGELEQAFEIRQKLMTRFEKSEEAPAEIYIDSLNSQGMLAMRLQKYAEAEEALARAVKTGTEFLSATHPVVLTFRQNLVMAKSKQGKKEAVIEDSREILRLLESQMPEFSPPVVNAKHQLAVYLASKESHEESLDLFQEIEDGEGPLPSRFHAGMERQTIRFLFSDDKETQQSAVEKLEEMVMAMKRDLGEKHPVTQLTIKRATDYRRKFESN